MAQFSNLKLGFFGHSIVVRNTKHCPVEHFIDNIARVTNSTVINDGSILCSEERILYELKKHKHIDVAIIFHSNPSFYFTHRVPKRDFMYVDESNFDSKYKNIRNFDGGKTDGVDDQAHESFFNGTALDREDFITGLKYFNRYFYDQDLQANRYQASLAMIDQYLHFKKIPVIHSLPVNQNFIPNWFSFTSGIVDRELQHFQFNQYRESDHRVSSNNINQEGNNIIAKKLLNLINAAIKKVNP